MIPNHILMSVTPSLLLGEFLSDGLDVKPELDQLLVVENLSPVKNEGRLLH